MRARTNDNAIVNAGDDSFKADTSSVEQPNDEQDETIYLIEKQTPTPQSKQATTKRRR